MLEEEGDIMKISDYWDYGIRESFSKPINFSYYQSNGVYLSGYDYYGSEDEMTNIYITTLWDYIIRTGSYVDTLTISNYVLRPIAAISWCRPKDKYLKFKFSKLVFSKPLNIKNTSKR